MKYIKSWRQEPILLLGLSRIGYFSHGVGHTSWTQCTSGPGVGYAVERGELIARENNYQLIE